MKQSAKLKTVGNIVAVVGAVLGIMAAVLSAVGGWLIYTLYRYIDTAQKALPTLEEAANVYLEEHKTPDINP